MGAALQQARGVGVTSGAAMEAALRVATQLAKAALVGAAQALDADRISEGLRAAETVLGPECCEAWPGSPQTYKGAVALSLQKSGCVVQSSALQSLLKRQCDNRIVALSLQQTWHRIS